MNQPASLSLAHFGICVSDMERSIAFYSDALGFVLDRTADIGPPFDKLTGLPGLKGRASFLIREGVTIELLHYQNPEASGEGRPRPMNQLGLSHMVFYVDDLQETVDTIVRHGGGVIDESRIETPMGPFIYCTDPDGLRLELWQQNAGG